MGSLTQTLQIDICNNCHPFFTGEVKFVDRQGRVDRFKKKMAAAAQNSDKNSKKMKKVKQADQSTPKSYRELLREQQSELRTQAKKSQDSAEQTKAN